MISFFNGGVEPFPAVRIDGIDIDGMQSGRIVSQCFYKLFVALDGCDIRCSGGDMQNVDTKSCREVGSRQTFRHERRVILCQTVGGGLLSGECRWEVEFGECCECVGKLFAEFFTAFYL